MARKFARGCAEPSKTKESRTLSMRFKPAIIFCGGWVMISRVAALQPARCMRSVGARKKKPTSGRAVHGAAGYDPTAMETMLNNYEEQEKPGFISQPSPRTRSPERRAALWRLLPDSRGEEY